jgi:hypothetical protein
MTLNQIIQQVQTAAESHQQVNKFVCGENAMAEEEVKFYPLVWLVPNGFDFDSEGKTVTYQFLIMVIDRHFESQSNLIEILSDTALILQDIITLLKRNSYEESIGWSTNAKAEPFIDGKTDVIAGYGLEISCVVPYLESYCDIPL